MLQRVKCLCCLLVLLLLTVSCQDQLTPQELSDTLLRKLEGVQSYQISFLLESSGQRVSVEQWYQSPHGLRTDVLEDERPVYRFIAAADRLHVIHLPSGQTQEVAVSHGSELFAGPLLLQCCRQASQSIWEHDSGTGDYISHFTWQTVDGAAHEGRLVVDAETLLPAEFELVFDDQQTVRIELQQIVLNPSLDENLFSLTAR